MMNMMHACERYGYLSINRKPIPSEFIARYCGASTLDEYLTLLAELDRYNVPRRTPSGIIYSKRMVEDEKKRGDWRKWKQTQRDKEDECQADVRAMSGPSSSSSSSSEPSSKAIAQNRGSPNLPGFEIFYQAYPKKVGKPAARRAWLSRVRDDSKWPDVIAALEIWKRSEQWQDKQFIPFPATFLNQKRWEDEVPKGGGLAEQNDEAAERVAQKHGVKRPN